MAQIGPPGDRNPGQYDGLGGVGASIHVVFRKLRKMNSFEYDCLPTQSPKQIQIHLWRIKKPKTTKRNHLQTTPASRPRTSRAIFSRPVGIFISINHRNQKRRRKDAWE